MPPLPELAHDDPGTLANNGIAILSLQSSLSRTEGNLSTVPKVLGRVIRDEAWRHWISDKGEFRWNAADFRRFLEAPRPKGCETPIHIVERALRDTEAWEPFQEMIRGEPGGCHVEGGHNPEGRNQWINRDSITDEPPVTLPHPAARDYQREAPTGTSTSYAVRRLGRNRPDLLDKVKAGDLSPHAAMVEAGFSKRKITIPDDPSGAVRILVNRFKGEALDALIRGLCNWAGIEIVEPENQGSPR